MQFMTNSNPGYTITAAEMKSVFHQILITNGFDDERALQCAEIFTANSVDGVYSHGVNRFSKFIQYVQKGFIQLVQYPFLKMDLAE
jgi:3-dehydro-L-gulonate 2-dehydrogenase